MTDYIAPKIDPDDEQDFSKVTTIGEMHAEASNQASKWSPRDALIRVLRLIDSKQINPDALIVVYRVDGPDSSVSWSTSSPSNAVTMSMLGQAFLRSREHVK